MFVAAAIALAASIGWGSVDFLTGRLSRRVPVFQVVALSQFTGFLTLLVVGLVHGLPDRHIASFLVFASLAGVTLAGAATAINAALSLGTMSLVAPLTGLSALVPIGLGLAEGETLTPLRGLGMALVLAALPIIVREPGARQDDERAVHLPIVVSAILLIGATLALASRAAQSDAVWAAAVPRGVCGAIVGAAAMLLARRPQVVPRDAEPPRPGEPRDGLRIAGAGAVDGLAAMCFTIATTRGLLTVVALLGSLYPVVTVILAHLLLRERLSRRQGIAVTGLFAGVACAVAG